MEDNKNIETKKEFLVKKYIEYYEENSELSKDIKKNSFVLSSAICCLVIAAGTIAINGGFYADIDNIIKAVDCIMVLVIGVSVGELYYGLSKGTEIVSRKRALENLMENIANRFYIDRKKLDEIVRKSISEEITSSSDIDREMIDEMVEDTVAEINSEEKRAR